MIDRDTDQELTPAQNGRRVTLLSLRNQTTNVRRDVDALLGMVTLSSLTVDPERRRDMVGAIGCCRELLSAIADTLDQEAHA